MVTGKRKGTCTIKSHKLSGNYKGRWECHIKPDWLLIWKQDDTKKEIYLERTGTHSDLFK
ncbi:type II toxin-antitoxin system YafQ family toxin [Gillisia sp. Q332]|uniref:type II toxin-antitoxin system YafQ family toxin n=1 Tax=Gillisia xinjiangensis TaxID=3384765 RepID=UPI00391B9242